MIKYFGPRYNTSFSVKGEFWKNHGCKLSNNKIGYNTETEDIFVEFENGFVEKILKGSFIHFEYLNGINNEWIETTPWKSKKKIIG